MKVSYNWLKSYIPDLPTRDKLDEIFTYHLCEVESVEEKPDGDTIFDINILPNRAHDLLSHQGIARELASLLGIAYIDPTPKFNIPESKPTNLKIDVQSNKCRRYMGRIVRNVKVGSSPDWVKNHLESIGQRSINNIVDGANITMYDCGQPIHCFDLDKVSGVLIIRNAKEGEEITTLDGKQVKLKPTDLVIADEKNVLAIAGVKGGKVAEVDENTKNIIIEVANFDPVSVRKTGRGAGIFTDALKRFENDLSPTLCDFGMREIAGLIMEFAGGPELPWGVEWEDVMDIYPEKPEQRKLKFRPSKISKILGLEVSKEQMEDILKRYNFEFQRSDLGNSESSDLVYEINVPPMRLDLTIEEDMAEEFGRILGYDKVVPKIPKINFTPKENETYTKIQTARSYLLGEGYSEVMTYTFCDKGEVEVLHSAGDKNFLRTNLSDGIKESIKLNQLNLPILQGQSLVKVFEIGKIFKKDSEEWHVVYGDKKGVTEMSLDEFVGGLQEVGPQGSPRSDLEKKETKFKIWSLFPFIVRDIALWVPTGTDSSEIRKVIKENMNELVVKGPDLFDTFSKDDRTSYGFRLIFQSYERTLTDEEVNEAMQRITDKLKKHEDWELR